MPSTRCIQWKICCYLSCAMFLGTCCCAGCCNCFCGCCCNRCCKDRRERHQRYGTWCYSGSCWNRHILSKSEQKWIQELVMRKDQCRPDRTTNHVREWIRRTECRARDPNAPENRRFMESLLWLACAHASVNTLQVLMREISYYSSLVLDSTRRDTNSSSPPPIISLVNHPQGETLLFAACTHSVHTPIRGQMRMIRYLLSLVPRQYHANWFSHARLSDGCTLAHVLVQEGRLVLLRELIILKRPAAYRNRQAPHASVASTRSGDKRWSFLYSLHCQSADGHTPLELALLDGDIHMVRLLVEEGYAPLVVPSPVSLEENVLLARRRRSREMWTWKAQQEESGGASHDHLVKYLHDCQWQRVSNLLHYLLNINWFLRASSSQSETQRGVVLDSS